VLIEFLVEYKDHIEYPEVQKYLDNRYSDDENNHTQKHNGNYMFRNILDYLTTHRKSTCKEIAKKYNESSGSNIKSIENNVRDFIKKNLIPYYIVKEDDVKKIGNKKIQTYSLTHFGILYTIHFFSKGDDFEYKLDTIRNLAIEYKDYFPKIFGRFDKFEKIIGKDFEYTLSLRDISSYIHELGSVDHFQDIANESVIHLDYTKQFRKKPAQEKLEDQISYIIYNNLLDNIEFYERVYDKKFNLLEEEKKQFGDWKKLTEKQLDDWHKINEKLDRVFYSLPKKAEIKWKKIIKSDSKINKWYFWFLDNSIKINEKKTNELRKMKTILR